MLLNIPDLKTLITALETARREATAPGIGMYCSEPNVGANGETFRWEPKPARSVGNVLRDGTKVEKMPDTLTASGSVLLVGKPGIRVPLGVHGRAFLVIDPETKQICCAACAKKGG